MTESARLSGIVLAGGRARRFGADKLAVEIEGRPLLHHAIEAVAAVASEVIVVVGPDASPVLPEIDVALSVARDARSDGGPLVGLIAGLEAARADTVIVVGGDMPSLVAAVLHALAARATADRAAALMDGSAIRPLPCALPRDRGLERAHELLAERRSSLRDLLEAIGTEAIPEAEWRLLDPTGDSLLDVDTPADLVRSARSMSSRPMS